MSLIESCDDTLTATTSAGADTVFDAVVQESFGNDPLFGPSLTKAFQMTILSGATIFGGFVGTACTQVRPDPYITVHETRPATLDTTPRPAARLVAPAAHIVDAPRTEQDEVAWLKDHSGLTWDQLGKAFGVSRRAVHMWANGGRLNEHNATQVHEFAGLVRALEAQGATSPEVIRSRLLAVDETGSSLIGQWRARHSSGPSWGMPHGPEHYIDAIQTPLERPIGEVRA